MREPDFEQLLRVLDRKAPSRPTLFEFFLNAQLYQKVTGSTASPQWGSPEFWALGARAYARLGYDYATTHASDMSFPVRASDAHGASRSMELTSLIHDRSSFEAYDWPDPDTCDFSNLESVAAVLESGMKAIVFGPCGVLENVMAIVGYETLCLMMVDDPELTQEVFDAVGSRLYRYYEIALQHPAVGAVIINDDWGFATQTMLSPGNMREYVFPWHRRLVELAHRTNRPAILHSCGQLEEVWEDIIEVMQYDGKHSYEDKILSVEDAYERYGRRIAILGGLDLDFVCRASPQEVEARSRAMLERSSTRGAYALGTGNSVPEYVPPANYFAMIRAATGQDYNTPD
jgi:uroporphyrinogen decarboxylase